MRRSMRHMRPEKLTHFLTEVEKNYHIVIINTNDNFKLLKFDMFYDFYGDKTSKRMEFIVDNKIVQTFSIESPARNSFVFYEKDLSELKNNDVFEQAIRQFTSNPERMKLRIEKIIEILKR